MLEISPDTIQFILDKLQVLNEDYTQIAVDVGVLKSQMSTIIWWGKAVAGTIVALVVTQLYQIFILHKNNKGEAK